MKSFRSYSVIHAVAQHCKGFYPVICQPFFSVGSKSLPVIICTISSSLITAFIMMKLLKIESKTAVLIGVGSSICGGSAIAATAPVIDADDEDVARSISVIFLFNILAALIFPALGHSIGLGTEGFAVFAGTAVNDTSSVTAAASTAENLYHTSGILSAAVTVKLTRTLAIIPITLALALYRTAKAKKSVMVISFASLSQTYEAEQKQLEVEAITLQQEIEVQERQNENIEKFIQKAHKYVGIEELDGYALRELVSAIYVDAPDKSSGKRVQHIHIKYDGLGFIPLNELMKKETA